MKSLHLWLKITINKNVITISEIHLLRYTKSILLCSFIALGIKEDIERHLHLVLPPVLRFDIICHLKLDISCEAMQLIVVFDSSAVTLRIITADQKDYKVSIHDLFYAKVLITVLFKAVLLNFFIELFSGWL